MRKIIVTLIYVMGLNGAIFAQYTGSMTFDTTVVTASTVHGVFNSVFVTAGGPAITFTHPGDSVSTFFEIDGGGSVKSYFMNHGVPNLGDSIINAAVTIPNLLPGTNYTITAHNLLYQQGVPVMFADALPISVTTDCSTPIISITGGGVTICSGNTITLTASGSSNFSWATGQTTASITVSPTITTTYVVMGGSGSCTATASTVVTVNSSFNPTISAPVTICSGGSTVLTASGGISYAWNTVPVQTTASIAVTPTSTKTYTVTITSGSCSGTESVTVTVSGAMNLTMGSAITICEGESAQLGVNAPTATSFAWTPATGLNNSSISNPIATPAVTTTYVVTVSNGTCTKTGEQNVTVMALPVVTTVTFNAGVLILTGTFPGKISQISINTMVYTNPWSSSTTQAIFNNNIVLNCGDNIYVKTIDATCVTVYPYTCTGIEEEGQNVVIVKQNELISLFDITGKQIQKINSPKDYSKKEIFQVKDLFINDLAFGCYFWNSSSTSQKFLK